MPMGAPGATLKVPVGTYEFGANLVSNQVRCPAAMREAVIRAQLE